MDGHELGVGSEVLVKQYYLQYSFHLDEWAAVSSEALDFYISIF
jgi:hypothetical protein